MPKKTHHEIYNDLKNELGSTFGYGDELQSGDAGFEDLMDAGTIADNTGKRIPRENGRNDRDRARLLGEHLRKGYPLYIYKKGEKYPREVRYDEKEGKLTVSEKPVTEMPEPEKPPRPGGDSFLGKTMGHLMYRVLDIMAMSVGTRLPSMKKWDDYKNAKKARKNVLDEHRVNRRLRQDSILNKENSMKCTNAKETYKSFAAELKNRLGYEKELNQKGLVNGISDLVKEGKIIDADGNPISFPENGTQEDLINSIGQRLYGNKVTDTRQPLYVYAKGEAYPREIFVDNEGKLRVSEKPINEMNNTVPEPSKLDKVGNAIGPGRNANVFASARAELRRKLIDLLSNKQAAADQKAPGKAKAEPSKKELEGQPPETKRDPAIPKPGEKPAEKLLSPEEQLAAMQKQLAELQKQMTELQQQLGGKAPPVQAKDAPEKAEEKVALNAQDKEPQQHQQELKNAENSKAPQEVSQTQPTETQPEAEKHAEEKDQKQKAEEKAASEQAKIKDGQEKSVVKDADEERKVKTSRAHEKVELLKTLKQLNGNKELPENVIKNVDQLARDAKTGEDALRNAVNSPEQALIRGGKDVAALAAYEATKEMASQKNPMLLNVLNLKNGADELQKHTRLEPSVAYAADNQHRKEFFTENFLNEEGKAKLGQKLDARFLEVHKKNEALKKSKDPLSELAAAEKQKQKTRTEPVIKTQQDSTVVL